MKVGDLVTLSAYAKNLKNFYNGLDGEVGIIVSVFWGSMFHVIWSNGKRSLNIDRRDLKYAKTEKK